MFVWEDINFKMKIKILVPIYNDWQSASKLLDEIDNYYSKKLIQYGETPRGVDWNGEEGQLLRFEQLCKVIRPRSDIFTINDLGCGYGALFDFMQSHFQNFNYAGIDISSSMIEAAQRRHKNHHNSSPDGSQPPTE